MKNKYLGFYLDSILSNIFLFLPIYSILFYESLDFSLSQIGILIAIIPLASLFSEIPTGVFADKFGRKQSTIVGYAIIALAYMSIFFYASFGFIIVMNILIGIGITFITGAVETWISDLVSQKKLSGFFTKLQSFDAIGTFISGLIGVVLVSWWGLSVIWLFASLSYLFGMVCLSLVPASNNSSHHTSVSYKEYFSHLKEAGKEVQRNKRVKRFVLSFFVLGFAYSFATNLAWIPFIENLGFAPERFGYVWSLMALMGVVAPFVGQECKKQFGELKSLRLLVLLLSLSFLSIFFVQGLVWAFVLLVVTLLFDQGRIPIEKAYFQSLLSQKKKSTITSLQSLLMSIGLIIGYPLVGLLAESFSSRLVLVLAGLFFLPLLWLYR